MRTSIFDLFCIGIGPSSSHTIGPMRAAKKFVERLFQDKMIDKLATINVALYGSLALTGVGHHTDKAIILGLMGELPETVVPTAIESIIQKVHTSNKIMLLKKKSISFFPSTDIVFMKRERLAHHSNGIEFTATDTKGNIILQEKMYSIGGGFIMTHNEITKKLFAHVAQDEKVPYPFRSGQELLQMCSEHKKTIAEIMLENEIIFRPVEELYAHIDAIWHVMQEAIESGFHTEGVLPGGLNVNRRAPNLYAQLTMNNAPCGGAEVLDWLSAFAIATNEENAAGGRVVTAPTNGSAGIIPAVLMYYNKFYAPLTDSQLRTFFLTAGAIGFLYKENASLSGAEMGCQGEVGVACSMAAAGLAALMGGTPGQIECAAEIGMEHNLGLTCDPVKGLVQIPCIERNSMGAVKAVNAARLAMKRIEAQKISLDRVIKTMKETGEDMKVKYKETSKGGLALHKVEC